MSDQSSTQKKSLPTVLPTIYATNLNNTISDDKRYFPVNVVKNMTSQGLFGWDLLYGSVSKHIKNNEDILVCLVHLVMVSDGFQCIGLGESKHIDGSEQKSEALPKGWNVDYAIRYVYQGRLYNLKATAVYDGIIINLIRVDERTVGTIQLNLRQVRSRTGSVEQMIPDYPNIVQQVKTELIEKVVLSSKSKTASSQTDEPSNISHNTSGILGRSPQSQSLPRLDRQINPQNYGRSDLYPGGIDPLGIGPPVAQGGGLGGGMLFQPSWDINPRPGNVQGIPPNSLPPGARFDPIRPDIRPEPQIPRRPDNDEFPPPGYEDMFM